MKKISPQYNSFSEYPTNRPFLKILKNKISCLQKMSSQFELFPLVAISVGFLLLMTSNFGFALECYMQAGSNTTVDCADEYPHCITLHCQQIYGDKTLKSCARFPAGMTTAAAACIYYAAICIRDPKFYCRYCDTDKCNKDGE